MNENGIPTETRLDNFRDINAELDRVTIAIEETTAKLDDAREAFLKVRAEHENAYSMALRETKLRNPKMTQTDIKAEATAQTYQKRLDVIVADSAYRRVINDLKALRDRLDAVREVSYNVRKEASIGR